MKEKPVQNEKFSWPHGIPSCVGFTVYGREYSCCNKFSLSITKVKDYNKILVTSESSHSESSMVSDSLISNITNFQLQIFFPLNYHLGFLSSNCITRSKEVVVYAYFFNREYVVLC